MRAGARRGNIFVLHAPLPTASKTLLLQVDTKNILFICGGAFVGLENQVSQRLTSSSIGFGNPVR